MTIHKLNSGEIEQDRLCRAGELAADLGERWADECRPGSDGCHELPFGSRLL
ncbi:MAG TPA: hypothetical protein VMF69_23195 [Gemmataceae bacterium]|nr:hypothetical protein [Gemmataceae bacterium]